MFRWPRELLRGDGGALVELADGRFALTGTTYAAGTARALKRHLRRRSRLVSEDDRAWLSTVIEELSRRSSPAAPRRSGADQGLAASPRRQWGGVAGRRGDAGSLGRSHPI